MEIFGLVASFVALAIWSALFYAVGFGRGRRSMMEVEVEEWDDEEEITEE